MIAHILFYFSKQEDLILDPMAGGGVTPDTCLVFNRRCWAFDMEDRPRMRPEIEPQIWTMSADHRLVWPVNSKEKFLFGTCFHGSGGAPPLLIFCYYYGYSGRLKKRSRQRS